MVTEFQPELDAYWAGVDMTDIVKVITKNLKTPYIERPPETFMVIKLPPREYPGVSGKTHFRCLRLDTEHPVIQDIPFGWIESVAGEHVGPKQTIWTVQGSSGVYTIELFGEKLRCNCKGFRFRHKCRHTDQIKETL